MNPQDVLTWHVVLSLLTFAAVVFFVSFGWAVVRNMFNRQARWYDRVLNQQLMLEVPPQLAVWLSIASVVFTAGFFYLIGGVLWLLIGGGIGALAPYLTVRHLEQKRLERLNQQLVDGITTMSSGLRAGLNIVQSFELLETNSAGPIKQEFAQLMREYQMGVDLNRAMRNAADRIGSRHYRLFFTALEMHRVRGGDAAASLDNLAESIREIQRLEGKLDALTSQGRTQAWMMTVAPIALLAILYMIDPEGVELLFTTGSGRLIMLIAAALIAAGYYWIRRIMDIDI